MSISSALSQIAVFTGPGPITTTSMPNITSSRRSASEKPSTANLEAAYGPRNGMARIPATEEILMMRPGAPFSARSTPRSGAKACVTRNGPVTFTSICLRNSSGSRSISGPETAMPALLTRPASVSPASASRTCAAPRAMPASSVTSKMRGTKRSPRSRFRLSASASLRTEPKTRKPFCASTRAAALPMPVETPVITTDFTISSPKTVPPLTRKQMVVSPLAIKGRNHARLARPSGGGCPAIDHHGLAGHEGTGRACKKDCRARNFIRHADALQRRAGGGALQNVRVVPQRLGEIGLDEARRDAVHADIVRAIFNGEVAGKLHVSSLGHAIGADDGRAAQAANRGDDGDGAILPLNHLWQDHMGKPVIRLDIGTHDLVEGIIRQVL